METKHTKGNWTIHDTYLNGTKGYEIHFNDDGECVSDFIYKIEDAKLIAAAPDLLEALIKAKQRIEFLEQYTEGKVDTSKGRFGIEQAIKKATA
jgi:hypothetical protein